MLLALVFLLGGASTVWAATAGNAGQNRNAEAERLIEKGEVDQAIRLLSEGGDTGARDSERLRLLGDAFLAKGQLDRAEASFREAMETNRRDHRAKLGLGQTLARAGKAEEAEEVLRNALRLNPKPGPVLLELGKLLEARKAFAEAISYYKQGIAKVGSPAGCSK